MIRQIADILARAGCDRIEFARVENPIGADTVKITLYRNEPPLTADVIVSSKELQFALIPDDIEARTIEDLIRKFP